MKRVILAAVSTVAGLTMLLSFKTRPASTVAALPPATESPSPTTSTTAPSGSTNTGSAATPTPTTVTGAAAQTRYGPVQVQITVSNGKITAVDAVEYPTESSRDAEINAYAIPRLDQEALTARSANIDMISGAAYTSSGFINSLQSALNKAGLS